MKIRPAKALRRAVLPVAATIWCLLALRPAAADVPRPADFLGFAPGADYHLVTSDQIVRYFRALDEASDRILVEEIGRTAQGRPIIMALISSPENLARREEYRAINRRLALARGLSDEDAAVLAQKGVATVWLDGGLHAMELGGSQLMPALAHWLVTDEGREAQRVRANVLLLLNPNMNPDGLEVVTSWYSRQLGTPFESTYPPVAAHAYVGNDINRDWYMFTQAEAKAVSRVIYHEWLPQIVFNLHQGGPFPSRQWVAPAVDPLNPHIDPMMVAAFRHIGEYQLARFMREGKPGVATDTYYRVLWTSAYMSQAPQLHNILGVFTETAMENFATPHCYTEEEATDPRRNELGLSPWVPSARYPIPWRGGCWHLRDAVDYMTTGCRAVLDAASRLKDDYLYNIYLMGKRQIARGEAAQGGPFAYVVDPAEQHDPGSAVELLRTLRQGGIEVRRAAAAFRAEGKDFPAGAYVVPPQAFRPFVLDVMEPKEHADRFEFPGGPLEAPYDLTGYNLPDQLGVTVHRVSKPMELPGPAVETIPPMDGRVLGAGAAGYLLSHDWNAAALASNRLMREGARLAWTAEPAEAAGRKWPAGSILVRDAKPDSLARLAMELGLTFYGLDRQLAAPLMEIRLPKVGIYQSYMAGYNWTDEEGWTRWVLDAYEFAPEVLHNADVRGGDLSRFDIIVLPDQDAKEIMSGHPAMTMPEGYTGGLGAEGAAALKRFVETGGWVMAAHRAVEFATGMFGLPIRNAVAGVPAKQYFVPGTLIRFEAEPTDVLAYGMAMQGSATFWHGSVVMDVVPPASEKLSARGDVALERDIVVYARFPKENLRLDGWAIGEKEYLAGKPAAIRAPLGKGQVVLLGFTPDTRGQSRNAFKLLFNPLYASTVKGRPGATPAGR
jgi:hypothetical protein